MKDILKMNESEKQIIREMHNRKKLTHGQESRDARIALYESGGSFDNDQYKIGYIADDVEDMISINSTYPPEILEKFKEGLYFLRKAEIYAHQIDLFVSGDHGEESFLSTLKQKIDALDRKLLG